MAHQPVNRAALTLLAVLLLIVTLFPLVWMLVSSFEPASEIGSSALQLLPKQWVTVHYVKLLADGTYIRSMLITFVGAAIFSVVGAVINSMAAYAFARIDFAFKRILWGYTIVTMFIPFMSIFITSFVVVHDLGMVNTLSVLIVPALAAAANVFFFRQFYLFFPRSVEEAAIIDGASRIGIFIRLFVPNSIAIFVIIGIQRFMGYWNSYVWAVMTITNPVLYTIMQKLSYFRSTYGSDWGVIMAGSSLGALPPLILLLIFQRYIIQGVKITGIK